MRLTVGILYHDSEPFAGHCLQTLVTQEGLGDLGHQWRVVCLDNGSRDTHSFDALRSRFPQVIFRQSRTNLGFGRGHNLIIREFPADFHAVLNIDTLLSPDFLATLLRTLDQSPKAGSACGTLLRWDVEKAESNQRTKVMDSLGIGATRAHRFFDMGQGKQKQEHPGGNTNRFGGSGAAVLYRRSALRDVAYAIDGREEYFDETMFAYKEDIDLAYRLQACGWTCLYVPSATAWHARTLSASTRRTASIRVRSYSAAHESLLLSKHRTWWPWEIRMRTRLRETTKWAFLMACEPQVFLAACRLLYQLRPEAIKRRSQTKHTVPYERISHLFS